MKKDKIFGIVLGIFFYLLSSIFFFYLYVFEVVYAGSIYDFSSIIFYIFYLIFPVIILVMPFFFKIVLKKKFYKSVIYSSFMIAIHIFVLLLLTFGIRSYFKTFTTEKWTNTNWHSFRYLMIKDLQKKYNLVGMTKEEIYQILGKEDSGIKKNDDDSSLYYLVKTGFLEGDYYIIILNDADIVTDIKNLHWD